MSRTSLLRALPALGLVLACLGALLVSGFHAPGHRGAGRMADGFRPGRWDARFVVARGPAALRAPGEAVRVRAWLSGPASIKLHGPDGERALALESTASVVDLELPAGASVGLEGDRAIRLHEIDVRRTGPIPWGRVVLILLAGLAGAAISVWRRHPLAVVASVAVTAIGAGLALRGSLAGVVVAATVDHYGPLLVVAGLTASFAAVFVLPASRPERTIPPRLPVVMASAVLTSCLLQVLLLPQPLLIGDPQAYHEIGGRFADAFGQVRGASDLVSALDALRPYGGLAATGMLYGVLRGVRDHPSTIYAAQALALAGAVFFLVRAAMRLGGPRLGLVVGLLALLYPTFPVICGIVQPEPFVLLLWTVALDRLIAARDSGGLRAHGVAGLAFALGLALHPQGMWFLLAALVLILLPFARRLAVVDTRRRAAAFALGLLPVALATAAGETFARPAAQVLDDRHGFWAYTARIPLGFWLFVDTDGWQGPLRIDDTRYARGLAALEQAEGAERGRFGRLAYTARFVVENLGVSTRTVLRNVHRLLHVPDNPFRRDWILPYRAQVASHRALVVLFLLSVPLLVTSRSAVVVVPLLLLVLTYPLYHIFNKYGVPATPFLLLGAGLTLSRLALDRPIALLAALAAAGVGVALHPADLAWLGVPPVLARAVLAVLHTGGIFAAFVVAARRWAPSRAARGAVAAAGVCLLLPALAASWGDPGWRTFAVSLDHDVRHEFVLGPEGAAPLDTARETFLTLDLQVPDGDPSSVRLEFDGGWVVTGQDLMPTMPTFGLATVRGERDPRTLRQWWKTPWRPEMAREGRVGLRVRGPAGIRVFGDLASPDAGGVAHGPSLGQWPLLSVYRLMHDGEYRLAARQPLAGVSRASYRDGRLLPGTLGVRLVVLHEDSGGARWQTAPATAERVVTAIWAKAGRSARADLDVPAGSLRFDFERPQAVSEPAGELRVFPTGEHEGWFVLRTPATPGQPLTLSVRLRQEMSSIPKYFLPELRPGAPIPMDWVGSPYLPPVRVLEAREAPPWRPARVY